MTPRLVKAFLVAYVLATGTVFGWRFLNQRDRMIKVEQVKVLLYEKELQRSAHKGWI